jgi:hypothetical protein
MVLSVSPGASATPTELTYRVTHAAYGDIGTYSNTIERSGGDTTVVTRVHFKIALLGVPVYREDAVNTEQWHGNRLVSFHGISNKGTESVEVDGEARGDNFVITSPHGTVIAPAAVRPANPWSTGFLASNVLMQPDDGGLEQVRVSSGEASAVKIDGTTIPARKFLIDGKTRYSVWFDGRGLPLQFEVDDRSGRIMFTLSKCVDCGPDFAAGGTG